MFLIFSAVAAISSAVNVELLLLVCIVLKDVRPTFLRGRGALVFRIVVDVFIVFVYPHLYPKRDWNPVQSSEASLAIPDLTPSRKL